VKRIGGARGGAALVIVSSLFAAMHPADGAAWLPGEHLSVATADDPAEMLLVRAADTKPHPAVVILHGRGTFEAFPGPYRMYAEELARHGMDAYLLSYYDSADAAVMRDGNDAARQQLFERRIPAWSTFVANVVQGIAAGEHAPTRIGLLGFSNGGFVAVAVAAEEPSVAALVELYGGAPAYVTSRLDHLPPLLIVHGDADRTIPVSEARSLAALAGRAGAPTEVAIYPGVGHGFDFSDGPHAAEARERVVSFLTKVLRK
jgi:carboxymethylenebutenolidase